jgi:hypothetical protein
MTTLDDYLPFDRDDNIYIVTEDVTKQKAESLSIFGEASFTCPTTLDQVWKEVENFVPTNNLININSIRYIPLDTILNNVLHVFSRYHDSGHVARSGDLILGVYCECDGEISIVIGGKPRFSKNCVRGFNMFSKSECIPLVALQFHAVNITSNNIVTQVVYGSILDEKLQIKLCNFYINPNDTRFLVWDGMMKDFNDIPS